MIFQENFYEQQLKSPFFLTDNNEFSSRNRISKLSKFQINSLHNRLGTIYNSIRNKEDPIYHKLISEVKSTDRFRRLIKNLNLANEFFENQKENFIARIIRYVVNFFRNMLGYSLIHSAIYPIYDWNSLSTEFYLLLDHLEKMKMICQIASQKVPSENIRCKIDVKGASYSVMISPDQMVYIRTRFIAEGASKKVYHLEKYDFQGNLQCKLAEMVTNQGIASLETENEIIIGDIVQSPFIYRISKFMECKDENGEDQVIFLSPYYEKTLDKCRELPFSKKVDIFLNILQGMKALHDRGYIHCDPRPANFFVNNGIGYVGDLGAAKRIFEEGDERIPISDSENIHGDLLPPECSRERQPQSTASDIYALGVTLRAFFKDEDHPIAKRLRSFAEFNREREWGLAGGMQSYSMRERPTLDQVINVFEEIKRAIF